MFERSTSYIHVDSAFFGVNAYYMEEKCVWRFTNCFRNIDPQRKFSLNWNISGYYSEEIEFFPCKLAQPFSKQTFRRRKRRKNIFFMLLLKLGQFGLKNHSFR